MVREREEKGRRPHLEASYALHLLGDHHSTRNGAPNARRARALGLAGRGIVETVQRRMGTAAQDLRVRQDPSAWSHDVDVWLIQVGGTLLSLWIGRPTPAASPRSVLRTEPFGLGHPALIASRIRFRPSSANGSRELPLLGVEPTKNRSAISML
jgi:hypothetical protein